MHVWAYTILNDNYFVYGSDNKIHTVETIPIDVYTYLICVSPEQHTLQISNRMGRYGNSTVTEGEEDSITP